jgi:hypothetical protein
MCTIEFTEEKVPEKKRLVNCSATILFGRSSDNFMVWCNNGWISMVGYLGVMGDGCWVDG